MPTDARDWVAWHEPYDEPGSPLHRRLAIVQRRLRDTLDAQPPGPVSLVSMCAGQGRDVIGVLGDHPRRDDVDALLVELDADNAAFATRTARDAGLTRVRVATRDASDTAAYVGAVPANVVLACGIFGNVSDDDVAHTVATLPSLCAPGATVIWTRHRIAPDLTPSIRRWFGDAGFEEVAFDGLVDTWVAVGTHRLVAAPLPFDAGVRLFRFVGDGGVANR
jgi:hypothetical protein